MESFGQRRVICSEAVTSVELDGERVLLHIETGEYYGLNALGAQIFELAEERPTIERVVVSLQETHPNVDPERVRADVLAFIQDMQSYELLTVREQSTAV